MKNFEIGHYTIVYKNWKLLIIPQIVMVFFIICINQVHAESYVRTKEYIFDLDGTSKSQTTKIFYSESKNDSHDSGTYINLHSDQQQTVSGRVTDVAGQALPGVAVVVKGTTQGTVTNSNGEYSITNVTPDAILVFSFVGMRSQESIVENRTVINVTLTEEVLGLEEVVVVGYGTQKKVTITGSVASVEGSELMQTPAINVTNRLAGRIPGLMTSMTTSVPGDDDVTFRVRGINTTGNKNPLIVVDGIANRVLERIDPADIESITVLKDASAAIYGAQAANGVILITTKRGKKGTADVSLNINQGFSAPTTLPIMADAVTYMTVKNEMDKYDGAAPTYSQDIIDIYRNDKNKDPWLYPETDWFKEVYKPLTPETYGNMSISGGSEKINYFISFGGTYQEGIHRNSGNSYSQANFRSNIDGEISKNIKISFDLSGRQSTTFRPRDWGDNPLYSHQLLLAGLPINPAWWPNGLPGPQIVNDMNPALTASGEVGQDRNRLYALQSLLKFDITIPWIKGLMLTLNSSYDKNIHNDKTWMTPYYLYYWGGLDQNGEPTLLASKAGVIQPTLSQYMSDGEALTLNALANYHLESDLHTVNILIGTERRTSENMNFSASRKYFPSDAIDQLFAGADLEKDNTGSASQSARLNYFGRMNYNFKSKYLAEAVFRYDGSYIFHRDYRYGFFPGFSLGWVMSEENFWKNNISAINFVKLRGSWGQTGNDRIGEYQYLATYGFRSGWKNRYVYNINEYVSALQEKRIPYEEITWEVANQTNVGVDLQMFDNKLNFSADYFYNYRSNILEFRNASVPLATGLTLPRENIGKVENKGFELQLSYHDEIGNLQFTLSPNISFARNKIIFWDEAPGAEDYMRSTGRPIGSELYYQAIGIFKDAEHLNSYPHLPSAMTGDIIFEDYNNDEKIDGLDQVRDEKGPNPKYYGGFNIELQYKNFYSSVFFQGAGGHSYYLTMQGTGTENRNYYKFVTEDRWTETNTDGKNPRAATMGWGGRVYWTENANTFWLRKGDYLRLKSMELGYIIPKKLTDKLGTKQINIYLSGLNLLTITSLEKGFDPEKTGNAIYSNWPINKVYNIGFKLDF